MQHFNAPFCTRFVNLIISDSHPQSICQKQSLVVKINAFILFNTFFCPHFPIPEGASGRRRALAACSVSEKNRYFPHFYRNKVSFFRRKERRFNSTSVN